MGKVKIPVFIIATASRNIGEVEIENPSEYSDAAYKLFEENQEGFRVNIHNNFDLGEVDIDYGVIKDWEYWKKKS